MSIKSEKILVKDIFSRMWFRIPEYQRPYVWTCDQVTDLLDDLTFAQRNKSDSEYFLGSFVFQSKAADPSKGEKFDENDLLDGQQRMSTLLMLFAVIRDLADDQTAKKACQECIYQEASPYKKIPERVRLIFAIREDVKEFIDEYVKTEGGTARKDELAKIVADSKDVSRQNMAQAILDMHKFFADEGSADPEKLLEFLLNKVLLIYVSTEDLEDAFRLFAILNDRGLPLRNSDILKSMNIGALRIEKEKGRYAKMWEEAEGELGDEFDRFLNYIRTILVKDKARMSLLQEFEEKIYASNGRRTPLLEKGKETFKLVEQYLGHYGTVLHGQNYDKFGNFEFDNLVKVMSEGLPATDWVPPLLRYFDRFKFDKILEFLQKLDNKFSADWISQRTLAERIEGMNRVIRTIDEATTPQEVLGTSRFYLDRHRFIGDISGDVYSKRYIRYLLLKLDYLYQDHSQQMSFKTLSVEHVLPQSPLDKSQWVQDFTPDEREEWTHRLGNLVLISRRKNSSLGRLDYKQKKERYFEKSINTYANSLRVLTKNDRWTLTELEANHEAVLEKLEEHYRINPKPQSRPRRISITSN